MKRKTFKLWQSVEVSKEPLNSLRVYFYTRSHLSLPQSKSRSNISRIWQWFNIGLRIAVIIFLLLPTVQAQEGAKPEDIGFVLNLYGKWFLEVEGQTPERINSGRALPAGGTIRVQSPDSSNFIDIVLLNTGTISRSCCNKDKSRKREECDKPISLPKTIENKSSLLERMLVSMKQLLQRPERPVAALSRGGGHMEDSVIKLEDDQVDLSPVFNNMEGGLYHLSFRTVVHDTESSSEMSLDKVDLKWEPDHAFRIKIKHLKPGLYKLRLLEMYGEHYEPTPSEAWVLFVEPEKFEQAFASYQEAVQLTSKWSEDIKPDSVRNFLRSYLELLAGQNKYSTAPK